jgi:predicted O-methyltransferase YrrM
MEIKNQNYYLPGSVKIDELKQLEKLASQSKDIIVEIGSFQGRSTVGLAKGSKLGNNNTVYAIDKWSNNVVNGTKDVIISKESFINNLKTSEVNDIVTPIHSTSNEAFKNWDKKIGMIFIDGDHSYQGVKNDIRWCDFVIPGGIIAFHDYLSPKYDNSVIRAVNEVKSNWNFHSHTTGLMVFTK